jgi:hypothetical protein
LAQQLKPRTEQDAYVTDIAKSGTGVGAGLLIVALAACGDATGASPLVGRYALVDVGGRTLPTGADPALKSQWGFCLGASLVRGTLELRAEGSFETRDEYLVECGATDSTQEMVRAGRYSVRGDTIEYMIPIADETRVVVYRGLVTETSITLPTAAGWEYRYRR